VIRRGWIVALVGVALAVEQPAASPLDNVPLSRAG
jgi:hypothetical protein